MATADDDALYVLTAVLLTPAQFPSVLGDDYPAACAALGLEPYAEGYGLVLGQDGAGARWTVIIDDVSLVAVAISSWDCGMEYDLSPDERTVVAALPGWPLAVATAAAGLPAPHDPEPEEGDLAPLSPPDDDGWGPAQRRLGADEVALQWAAWRAQMDGNGDASAGDGTVTGTGTDTVTGTGTGTDTVTGTGMEADGEAGSDAPSAGPAAGAEATAGAGSGGAGSDGAASGAAGPGGGGPGAAGAGATASGAAGAGATASGAAGAGATASGVAGAGATASGAVGAERSVPARDPYDGVRRALAELRGYLEDAPPVGRVRSSFAAGEARMLRADGPGWSLVARTDDMAFVLLDDEPREVLPIARGPKLPALLEALDAMAVRPT
ncbi:hypothetical protein ACIPPS_06750 [Streptomyces sp. NPDC090127]|uniref:hypothetical protein n=1 Tax=Streptomyces sp. NPDC090127 TaxID=3365953 RepID=UPI00380D9459